MVDSEYLKKHLPKSELEKLSRIAYTTKKKHKIRKIRKAENNNSELKSTNRKLLDYYGEPLKPLKSKAFFEQVQLLYGEPID